MISISVKSKYGSCSRNCTGLININNIRKIIKKKFFFYFLSLYSLKVKRGTVNTLMYVRFMLRALKRVGLMVGRYATVIDIISSNLIHVNILSVIISMNIKIQL